ncbi:hypothetical protein D3C84_1001420 [compost metagenome]
MDVQRNLQLIEGGKNRGITGVVEERIARSTIDQRAFEAQLRHRPLQLTRRRLGCLPRERGKTAETIGLSLRRLRQLVIGSTTQLNGLRGGQ